VAVRVNEGVGGIVGGAVMPMQSPRQAVWLTCNGPCAVYLIISDTRHLSDKVMWWQPRRGDNWREGVGCALAYRGGVGADACIRDLLRALAQHLPLGGRLMSMCPRCAFGLSAVHLALARCR